MASYRLIATFRIYDGKSFKRPETLDIILSLAHDDDQARSMAAQRINLYMDRHMAYAAPGYEIRLGEVSIVKSETLTLAPYHADPVVRAADMLTVPLDK